MEYHKFVEFIKDSMFNFSAIKMSKLTILYEEYESLINETERELKEENEIISAAYEMFKNTDFFSQIKLMTMQDFLWETFNKKRIDNDGYCLKENLIGRAVELNNTDLLGIVSDISDSKHLFIDFGDEKPIKTRIDELKIAGQKSL